jgi:hypothetical protein
MGLFNYVNQKARSCKNRKSTLKYELQKRRESLFKDNVRQNLEFPEISNADMKIL